MTLSAPATVLDIVYLVRPGDRNDELKYSLRSLRNVPHGAVWIVGHKPAWVTNVRHIPGNPSSNARINVYQNVLAACQHPDTPDEFVIFNDDFFVTEPLDDIGIWYRSTLQEHLALPRVRRQAHQWWGQSLAATMRVLRDAGITDPLSYELHVPFRVNKQQMADTLARFAQAQPRNPPQWRTLYGNINDIGGQPLSDSKCYKAGEIRTPFHSTEDSSWRHFAGYFQDTFTAASPYEIHTPTPGESLDTIMLRYGSDKASQPSQSWQWAQDYCRKTYEPLFNPLRDQPVTLLELGWGEYDPVRKDHNNPDNGGRSARAWSDYFHNGTIISIDLAEKTFPDQNRYPRVRLYDRTDQTDQTALATIHDGHGDFDIIIDDASHISTLTIRSFEILWPWLKPGGWYIIEDLHSSYHDYYFGPDANRDPTKQAGTAMGFFTRLAHEPFFTGKRPKGPAVNGDPCSWDCYPRKYWLGYQIEEIRFCHPQLIAVRKRAEKDYA